VVVEAPANRSSQCPPGTGFSLLNHVTADTVTERTVTAHTKIYRNVSPTRTLVHSSNTNTWRTQ